MLNVSENKCSVKLVVSLEKMQEMEEVWNKLLAESHVNTIFLTWEWLFVWARCFLNSNRQLFVICVYQSDQLIGIAPFYIEKVRKALFMLREIRFLGSPEIGSDYLDVISRKGREKIVSDTIYDLLFSNVYSATNWDKIYLSDLPSESYFLMNIMNRLDEDGKYSEIGRCSVMPQLELPGNIDDFFSMLSSNRRERFRRDMRRVHKEGKTKHLTFRSSDIKHGLDRFFSLYNSKTEYDGAQLHNYFELLLKSEISNSWIQFDILCVDNRDIAGLLHLNYGNNLLMLLMAVDKNFNPKISLGNLLVGLCMQDAIQRDMHIYDFLKGQEEYKFHWASNIRTSLILTLYRRNTKGLIAGTFQMLKYAIKLLVR